MLKKKKNSTKQRDEAIKGIQNFRYGEHRTETIGQKG